MNNNNNSNNMNNTFGLIDILTLISFLAQMKNMNDDEFTSMKNNSIIKAVADEIDKLHKENDNIIEYLKSVSENEKCIVEKLDIIIKFLERGL